MVERKDHLAARTRDISVSVGNVDNDNDDDNDNDNQVMLSPSLGMMAK